MKLRYPDLISLYTEKDSRTVWDKQLTFGDARVCTKLDGDVLKLCAAANETPLRYIRLYWRLTEAEKRKEPIRILGDEYERGYGLMEWRGIVPQRCLTWTCSVSNGSDSDFNYAGRFTECFGVKVRPNAMCFWQYDGTGLTLWADVRCGGMGVVLKGRTLDVCSIVFAEYRDTSAFRAVHGFYKTLCDDMLSLPYKVYGSNNWYYAYGISSHEEILGDAKIVADQCTGLTNRPYMVIDDGWQKNTCDAPWDKGSEKFPDMKGLADGIRSLDVRPGIWIRYLNDEHNEAGLSEECHLSRDHKYLDPSHPEVKDYIIRTTKRIVDEWGYTLIKHDYSTYDLFGDWGINLTTNICHDGWSFYDRSRTSAEIVIDFYRTIHEAAGDAIIIGCNVMGHLTAGLAHLNRTGNDTSGRFWEQTRLNGVNTVGFHMIQDKTFFAADGDCVGITEMVDWRMNRKWLKLLSVSGTPLFISCKPGVLNAEQLQEVKEAFARSSVQEDVLEPVDWMENICPDRWLLNGEELTFDWYEADGIHSFVP